MKNVVDKRNFWHKYSPNYESYTSFFISLIVHFTLAAFILLLGWDGIKKAIMGDVNRRMGVSSIKVGGSSSMGNPDATSNEDSIKVFPKAKSSEPNVIPEFPSKLDPNPKDKIQVEKSSNKSLVDDANSKAQELSRLGQNLKGKMIDSLNGVGNVKGTGVGDGRGERMLRWIMIFSTMNGTDYLSQLIDLNARIAFPDPEKPDKFLVISNLSMKPIVTMELDLSSVSDIFWVDDKTLSVANLSRALGLQLKIQVFVVLMPVSVEQKLNKLEKTALQGVKEDEIQETRFSINKIDGKYEPTKAEITFKKK